ncbi:MAG TPA: LptF/LptG family permease [Planctomycetota bacterium]|nr:LptF/LptG family permease [Planctomycetota bacterium]
MLGRRLDRYIGLFFVWHFILCLTAIVLLYVLVDTFAKLDDFIEQDSVIAFLRWIVIYHAYQVPVLLTQFLPLVTLLAGVISITRLARYNELNAIKAVGVSLHRALAPILLCSLAVAALAAANQELLVPSLAPDLVDIRARGTRRDTYTDLSSFDRNNNATVWVSKLEYALPGFELAGVEVRSRAAPDPARKAGGPPQWTAGPWVRGADAVWVDRWLFLWNGEAKDAQGQWKPLEHMAMPTTEDATRFTLPRKQGTASELAPVVRIHADRDGHPVEVIFSSWTYKGALRLILGGQLTCPLSGEQAPAPIFIQAALWRDQEKAWLGRANTYLARETRRDEIIYDGEPLPFTIPPHQLIKSEADPTLKSFRELLQYHNDPPALRQKKLVLLHSRVAFPLSSIVLLLVAVPLLFQQEGGKSTWVGMGLALLVCMGFYVVNYLSQLAGQNPEGLFASAPALAAWLPILSFAALGGVLMARMNT